MFPRILVPVDGSPCAERILGELHPLLVREDAELLLLRAYPARGAGLGEPIPAVPDAEIDAKGYLHGLQQRLRDQGARVRCLALEGAPAETILERAAAERVALIAMTTHGYSGIPRWAFGSVTEKVLRASTCPMLVVRSFKPPVAAEGETPPGADRSAIRKILVPINEDDTCLGILPYAGDLAKTFHARVILVNVVGSSGAASESLRGVEKRCAAAEDRLVSLSVPVGLVMRTGDAAAQILDACHDLDADLIAMTTHGRSGVSRWAFGSVTEKVLRAATVPVLVVRGAPPPARS